VKQSSRKALYADGKRLRDELLLFFSAYGTGARTSGCKMQLGRAQKRQREVVFFKRVELSLFGDN